MRFLPVLLAMTLNANLASAEDKKDPKEETPEPIKVVQLDRKDLVSYEKEIVPLLEKKCMYCHRGASIRGKYDMSTYEGLLKGGSKRSPAILPGRANDSPLIKMAGHTVIPVMPPPVEESPLTPEELALFKLWIDQGAKGPTTAVAITKPPAKLGKLPEGVKAVLAVAVSPDKALVAMGRGNQIHLYEAATGNFVRSLVNAELKDDKGGSFNAAQLDVVCSLAFSPDNKLLAAGGFQEITLWDPQTGEIKHKLTGLNDRVVALDFSKDGNQLLAAGGAPTEEGEIKVFDVTTQKLVVDIKNGHSDTVFGARFSPDGTMIATCGADKFIKVFEVPSGKFLKSFEGHTHHVMDVGWKSDGKVLASCGADNAIKIWDFEKGEQIRTINNGHTKQITRLVLVNSNPEQFITVAGDANARFWNVQNGAGGLNLGGNTDFLYAVSASPDGTLVAVGGQEGVVRLYNGRDGKVIKVVTPPAESTDPPKK